MAPKTRSNANGANGTNGGDDVIDLTFSPPSGAKKRATRSQQNKAIAAAVQSARDNAGKIGRAELQAAIEIGMEEPEVHWAVYEALERMTTSRHDGCDDFDDDNESITHLLQNMSINNNNKTKKKNRNRRANRKTAALKGGSDDDSDDDGNRKPAARPRRKDASKENQERQQQRLPRLSEDYRLAKRLQKQEEKQLARAKKEQEKEMLKHHDGKAFKFVEGVQDLCKKFAPDNGTELQPVGTDDMVWTTKRLLEAQEQFRAAGKPCSVVIAYHYTSKQNLANIKTEFGLLSPSERDANKIKSKFNGSAYGSGIYCAPDVSFFHGERYGKECLMVAILKGASSVHPAGIKFDAGNDSVTVPYNPAANDNKEWFTVLQHSQQCIPLLHFPDTMVAKYIPADARNIFIRKHHAELQKLIDGLFNDSKRTTLPLRYQLSPKTINYFPPFSLALSVAEVSTLVPTASLSGLCPSEECPICLDPLINATNGNLVQLKACNHKFHSRCLEQTVQHGQNCPNCRKALAEPRGAMPSGTMTDDTDMYTVCRGFEPAGSIVIVYNIPDGIQLPFHPSPGKPYFGTKRTAYIPESAEGRNLLKRLEYAFSHGLTFSVGTSLTTGQDNTVIWGSIHHKTSTTPGPHGFPDPNFFANCNRELDDANVPPADELP